MSDRVVLVGVVTPEQPERRVKDQLLELAALARTLEYKLVEQLIVNRQRIDPATFIGRGKVQEIASLITSLKVSEVIFNDDLSPTQMRNLERRLNAEVHDRSGIILEIFANHARTKEAKTQVELATLEYLLPRLTRRWTHLERQIGGIGVRGGAGETQIEVDRRLIRTRIARLKKELEKIDKERTVQSRRRGNVYKIALVGYTNTGKSTLMNLLTSAEVITANKLFATLDTTIRKYQPDKNRHILLSDTVGFIRKLPPGLVASFRSTLKELVDADLIIKLADVSIDTCFDQLETVDEVLVDMGLSEKPFLTVFNKIDRHIPDVLQRAKREYPRAIFISALKNLRVGNLQHEIIRQIRNEEYEIHLIVPVQNSTDIARIRDNSIVQEEQYLDSRIALKAYCNKAVWHRLVHRLSRDISFDIVK